MYGDKILQVAPVPAGLWEVYEEDDGTDGKTPIVCICLEEDSQGHRYLLPYSMCADGSIEPAGECSNFKRVAWEVNENEKQQT